MDHGLDRVNLKMEFVKKTSVPSLYYVLDPFVKIRIVWYAQVHNTHTFYVLDIGFRFFGLTDIDFHE